MCSPLYEGGVGGVLVALTTLESVTPSTVAWHSLLPQVPPQGQRRHFLTGASWRGQFLITVAPQNDKCRSSKPCAPNPGMDCIAPRHTHGFATQFPKPPAVGCASSNGVASPPRRLRLPVEGSTSCTGLHRPGRPGGYPPGLPQIRTCPIKASGSSPRGFTIRLAIRRGNGNTGTEGQSPRRVAPRQGPRGGAPFPPPGARGTGLPSSWVL